MHIPQSQVKEFQQMILSWYEQHKRDLPWRPPSLKLQRDGTKDPYKILVSEVMSQQTQLSRVIPKYNAWMKRFPTVTQLAEASLREVLRYWSGLGYNSRALNLQKTARILVSEYSEDSASQRVRHSDNQKVRSTELSEFSGKIIWPQTVDELIELPGIGKYTASAIACFAFDAQIPVVDTNIRKVILTHFCQNHPERSEGSPKGDSGVSFDKLRIPRMTEKEIEAVAWQILPKNRAYEWNQALMDYSSLVLKDKKIPVPKQSHFLTSDRYFRGQIIKLLLEVKSISFSGLLDYFADRNPIEQERLRDILESMAKDGLVVYRNEKVSFPA